jgi:hypothetical protein
MREKGRKEGEGRKEGYEGGGKSRRRERDK